MSKVITLKEKCRRIRRRFKRVNRYRFFYNRKGELQGKHPRIEVWFLIHDKDKGYSIFHTTFRAIVPLSVLQWKRLFSKRNEQHRYDSIYSSLTQKILPSINNKGAAWRFISLIGWSSDLPEIKNPAVHDRDKSTKAENANARNTHRRRHRNKAR